MIRITVPALPVRNIKGTSTRTNKPYDMNVQTVYCHVSDLAGEPLPFPEKSEVVLDQGQAPYAPGEYTLSPASLYVDRNGRLAVAPKLVPIQKRAA